MRIYIGNTEIAGYFGKLKLGFDELGVKADFFPLADNKYYGYKVPKIVRCNQYLFTYFKKNKTKIGKFPLVLISLLGVLIIHFSIFIYALIHYDVFILNSHPFFHTYELAILKLFKKKIIFVFLGTESRPAYISGNLIKSKYTRPDGTFDTKQCYEEVKSQASKIKIIEKYADITINHPPTALLQTKPFIKWLHIGFPSIKNCPIKPLDNKLSRMIKIFHATSMPKSKGTDTIIKIVENLKSKEIPVELISLIKVPNEKILSTIDTCDIIVDELYSDIPLGGLGTEAAIAGRPVINGGYYSTQINNDYNLSVIPPAIYCHPNKIEDAIFNLIYNKENRIKIGRDLHKFVNDNWSCKTVAEKYIRIIENQIPKDWYCDPQEITFYMGYGMNEQELKVFLSPYIKDFGICGLSLSHNLTLTKKLLEFADIA